SRWLAKTNRRELDRLTTEVEAAKATQNAILETILSESLSAWERSKQPRTKIHSKEGEVLTDPTGNELSGPDGQPLRAAPRNVTEVVQRDGNPVYLDLALLTLAHLRKLWGLDVEPARADSGPMAFAAIVA